MNRHLLEDRIEFLQLKAFGRVLLILGRDIPRHAGLTAGLVLGTFQDDLNSVSFFCHFLAFFGGTNIGNQLIISN